MIFTGTNEIAGYMFLEIRQYYKFYRIQIWKTFELMHIENHTGKVGEQIQGSRKWVRRRESPPWWKESCQMSVRDVQLVSSCSPQGITIPLNSPHTFALANTHDATISARCRQTIFVWNWTQQLEPAQGRHIIHSRRVLCHCWQVDINIPQPFHHGLMAVHQTALTHTRIGCIGLL